MRNPTPWQILRYLCTAYRVWWAERPTWQQARWKLRN